jgi:hypothetical protein
VKENPHTNSEHDSIVQRFDQIALLLVAVTDSAYHSPVLAYIYAMDALKALAILRAQVIK